MQRVSLLLAVLMTISSTLPTNSAAAESEAELLKRGRYILSAIEGSGCHPGKQ